MKRHQKKLLLTVAMIAVGIASRLFFHDHPIAPNVEIVTVLSLLAGYYLGGWFALVVPFGVMAGSDFFIGNTGIFLFTWSAYLIGGLAGYLLRSARQRRWLTAKGVGLGLLFTLFFYLYTNFGVWLITPWYERGLNGLLYCYYMGLPFLKYQLVGNLIFVTAGFTIAETIRRRVASKEKLIQAGTVNSKQ
ncbi:MAG: DUF6580 family putative transport protein [Patescibacteria group bacterium]